MKISSEWLKDLSGSKLKTLQIAELLSEHTTEAEMESGTEFKHIIVAQVTKIEKHPNADKLRVITLTDGQKDYYPIVCGAWNFGEGAKVPLALPGAEIPHDQHDPEGNSFVLGKATIRGVESQGMICSGKELGLTQDGDGIMILDQHHKLGSTFTAGHESLDVSSFANRPDLHSYLGVAMEVSALTGSKLNMPKLAKLPTAKANISIKIDNKHCLQYSAVTLKNIKIQESPEFIRNRLTESGLRPINNIVDITNYVMLLTGQPLHAFDASKIDGGIVVRHAESSESLITLDGKTRALDKSVMVIADHKKTLAVAGIIGGQESAVTSDTTELVLESASFDAVAIRKASRFLGVRTDSSSRFEKSLPLAFTDLALTLAIPLFEEHAGAKVTGFVHSGKKPDAIKPIKFTPTQINDLLGIEIPITEQKQILQSFDIKVVGTTKTLEATPPFWRPDIAIWQDLAEEIARHKSIDKIPAVAPAVSFSSKLSDPLVSLKTKIANNLAALGLSEIYTYSFTNYNDNASVEVANPMNDDQKYMRTSILPGMAHVAQENSRYFDHGMYFEMNNIYRQGGNGFNELSKLGLLAFSKHKMPVSEINGVIHALGHNLGLKIEHAQHAPNSSDILANGKAIGTIETIPDNDLLIVGASLDLKTILTLVKQNQYRTISKYPEKSLDTSIVVDLKVTWSEIVKAAGQDPLLAKLELVDVYQGKGVPSHQKSLTIRAVYQSQTQTLTDAEVETLHTQIINKITQKTKGFIR